MKQHLGSGIGIDSRREQISLPQGQTPRQVRIAREALPRAAASGHQLVGACGVRIRRPGCPVHIPVDRIQCCLRPRVRFRREFPAATQGVFRQAAAGDPNHRLRTLLFKEFSSTAQMLIGSTFVFGPLYRALTEHVRLFVLGNTGLDATPGAALTWRTCGS